ncbi:hypothetical protein ACWCQN_25265 [Streptomyces sp. NPDC001984]
MSSRFAATMLSDLGAHLLLFHVRPNLARSGLGGKLTIFTDYHSLLSDYLVVALPLGF